MLTVKLTLTATDRPSLAHAKFLRFGKAFYLRGKPARIKLAQVAVSGSFSVIPVFWAGLRFRGVPWEQNVDGRYPMRRMRRSLGLLCVTLLASCSRPMLVPRVGSGPLATTELVRRAEAIFIGSITNFKFGDRVHSQIALFPQ